MKKALILIWALLLAASMILAAVEKTEINWPAVALAGAALILLLFFYKSTVLPARVVKRGFELLESQDFNNRLVKVGESNADRVVGLFNTMIDSLRAERLKNLEQESFLSLLIDASPMGVVMIDLDGKVSMANPAFLRMASIKDAADVVGRRMEEVPSELARLLAGIGYQETRVVRPGDSRLLRCSHLSFVQSGFNRRFYLVENLTEEVMKAERSAYEKVIRTISHEVNNTMGGVRSVFGLLAEETPDDEMREVIESCDHRCDELCGFIRDYADVVKLPAPQPRRMDIAGTLTEMLPFLRMIAGDGIEIKTDIPSGEIFVMADRAQLEQVVVNIVKNAVESFEGMDVKDRYVSIVLEREAEGVVVGISNNGAPISAETERQLFSPFFTTKRDGKGLGLTLTAEILGAHGATWRLRTEPSGETLFRIVFRR